MPESVTTPVTEQRNDSNSESVTTDENSSTDISTEDGTEGSSEGSEGSEGDVEIDVNSPAFKAAVEARIEEVVNERLAGEKDKLTAAEALHTSVGEKLSVAEAALETVKSEKALIEAERDEALKNHMHLELSIEEKVSPELIKSLKGETKEELRNAIKLVQGSSKQRVDRIFEGKDSGATKLDLAGIAHKSAKAFLKR